MEIKNWGKIKFLSSILLFLIIPKFSFSATLYLQPSSKNLNVGDNLIVTVYVDASDQAINAASGRISWDNSILKYVSHSKSGSIFNFWVREPTIEGNEFVFEGVVFNPGFQGKTGKILTINFKTVKPGETKVDFISGMVLANDGYGTNILKAMMGGSYKVVELKQQEKITVSQNLPPKPIVISPTHPDPNKWYNNNNPVFEWQVPSNVSLVRIGYGEKPNINPTIKYSPPISKKELENIPDGTYYFAVQFENRAGRSEIARFKFNIDTKPPEIIELFFVPKETGLHLKITATDTLSGLDITEIYIDNTLTYKENFVNGEIIKFISGLEGTKNIKIVIKDQSANETVREETIFIRPSEKPVVIEKEKIEKEKRIEVENKWLIFFGSLNFALFILIIILILIIEKIHRRVRNIQWEIFEKKYKDKVDNFLKEMKEEIINLDQDQRFSEEQRNILRRFKEIIERAEKEFEEYLKKEKNSQ